MAWVAGVDGCRGGWFRACRETTSGELRFDLMRDVPELLGAAPRPEIVALDIPIGLPDAGPRECDRSARRILAARRSSVFPAPIRAAVAASTRLEADEITRRTDGRGVGAQAYGIYPKICEVDAALGDAAHRDLKVREVHPEVSFCAWNGARPMAHSKKSAAGLLERLQLIEGWLGTGLLERARGSTPKKHLADDDIVDAIACLWTAHRISEGHAQCLPPEPDRDAAGLRMEIVF